MVTKKSVSICREFTKEKDKTDRKEMFRKERQQKREQQDYENYKEWIEIAGKHTIFWY